MFYLAADSLTSLADVRSFVVLASLGPIALVSLMADHVSLGTHFISSFRKLFLRRRRASHIPGDAALPPGDGPRAHVVPSALLLSDPGRVFVANLVRNGSFWIILTIRYSMIPPHCPSLRQSISPLATSLTLPRLVVTSCSFCDLFGLNDLEYFTYADDPEWCAPFAPTCSPHSLRRTSSISWIHLNTIKEDDDFGKRQTWWITGHRDAAPLKARFFDGRMRRRADYGASSSFRASPRAWVWTK
ncbi:hypothetical protein K438DRAFT_2055202 [Mycena galopus ATCC 62051]|nr:hypothetical protein K438DRAFT_2055202 [Mycena galopus ATCC 62051]